MITDTDSRWLECRRVLEMFVTAGYPVGLNPNRSESEVCLEVKSGDRVAQLFFDKTVTGYKIGESSHNPRKFFTFMSPFHVYKEWMHPFLFPAEVSPQAGEWWFMKNHVGIMVCLQWDETHASHMTPIEKINPPVMCDKPGCDCKSSVEVTFVRNRCEKHKGEL